ncbi:hypothetical protein [Nocardioides convexus]|uniref:hypothetical protein n=1 Tax=Nocardioides convexus TaxID=2712224 RepID=UPI00241871A4|nr:hypothetical protein [Nocardioides convexus]
MSTSACTPRGSAAMARLGEDRLPVHPYDGRAAQQRRQPVVAEFGRRASRRGGGRGRAGSAAGPGSKPT